MSLGSFHKAGVLPPEAGSGEGKKKGSFRFQRAERLKGRREIREVFRRGKGLTCFGAKLFVLPNGLSHNRIAFTFSRKFGTAVERNRARRLGREAYRHIGYTLKPGYDVVLLVYPGTDTLTARMEQVKRLFAKADLMENPSWPRNNRAFLPGRE
ncbi:MAG: ribonuclease P protein component [Treponema sp.]|nr:ribonuclease P protein component [Treponema sp.]